MSRTTVAVVVCAYTLERWDDLVEALSSAARQSLPPDELWLVVDHNDALLLRARETLLPQHKTLQVLPNDRTKGLSGARNTALERVGADVVVFLDDDAAAEEDWLALLTRPYEDESVVAVGGSATPRWSAGRTRPATLPTARPTERGELDWVVGCSYRGQPESQQSVRNLMGCNMSFRRAVFAEVGGFAEHLGRVGKVPLGCEETELCIRVQSANPRSAILFEPAAQVHHHVSSDRLTWTYLRHRCYAEGLSKAAVASMVGRGQALSSERQYASRVLPAALVRELMAAARTSAGQRGVHLLHAFAVVLGLGATTLGYIRGRIGSASARTAVPRLALRRPSEAAGG